MWTVDLWDHKVTMTSAQAFIVLEVEEGTTADEINQTYKKGVQERCTILGHDSHQHPRHFDFQTSDLEESLKLPFFLIWLQSQAHSSSSSRFVCLYSCYSLFCWWPIFFKCSSHSKPCISHLSSGFGWAREVRIREKSLSPLPRWKFGTVDS